MKHHVRRINQLMATIGPAGTWLKNTQFIDLIVALIKYRTATQAMSNPRPAKAARRAIKFLRELSDGELMKIIDHLIINEPGFTDDHVSYLIYIGKSETLRDTVILRKMQLTQHEG